MWNLFLSGRHGQVSTINSPLVALEMRTQSHFKVFSFLLFFNWAELRVIDWLSIQLKKKITSKGEIRELAHSSRSFERGTRNRRVGNENCSRRTGSSSRVDRGSLYGARGFVCVCWRVSSARQQPPPLPLSFLPFQKNCIYTQHIRCGGPFTWPSSGRRLNKMKFFLWNSISIEKKKRETFGG